MSLSTPAHRCHKKIWNFCISLELASFATKKSHGSILFPNCILPKPVKAFMKSKVLLERTIFHLILMRDRYHALYLARASNYIAKQNCGIFLLQALIEVCVPRHLSRLWGRSTAVTAVSSRQNRDAPAETLLGLRQGQLYVAGDSDILLSRSSRGEGLFCPSIYIIAIKSQIVQKNQKNFIIFTISPQKLSNFAIIKLNIV